MERPVRFAGSRIGINAVVETNRANGQFVAQAGAYPITHVVQPGLVRARQQITRIEKYSALELTVEWKRVLGVKDGEELTA